MSAISALNSNNRLIFETLLIEAEQAVQRKIKKGEKSEQAISEVSDKMSLNAFETEELIQRVKKNKADVPVKSSVPLEEYKEADPARTLSIYFEDAEQSQQAIQLLMDRSIPWATQGIEGDRPFIQFAESIALEEAQSALRRRWDFVENKKRLVADVQFDNLSDYNKVLEYMRRQGMLLEFNQGIDLDEDYDELQNQKAIEKKLAEKEGRIYEDRSDQDLKSFVARVRDSRGFSKANSLKEAKYRTACVRKRWK